MKLVDLELDDEEKTDFCAPMPCGRPDYPYGTRVSFDQGTLRKLKKSAGDFAVSDMIYMRCFGVVTSISADASESGTNERVEIQIQKIGMGNENTEEGLGGEAGEPALPKGLILYAMRKRA